MVSILKEGDLQGNPSTHIASVWWDNCDRHEHNAGTNQCLEKQPSQRRAGRVEAGDRLWGTSFHCLLVVRGCF